MPAKNKLSDLRDHLFETLEGLKDEHSPMDVDRAKAVANVAQAIIHSAKLELQFLQLSGQESESEFLAPAKAKPALLPVSGRKPGA